MNRLFWLYANNLLIYVYHRSYKITVSESRLIFVTFPTEREVEMVRKRLTGGLNVWFALETLLSLGRAFSAPSLI